MALRTLFFFFVFSLLLLSHAALAQMIISNEPGDTAKHPSQLKFFNKTEAGVSFGIGSYNTDIVNGVQKKIRNDEMPIVLQTITGLKYKDEFAVGLSVGADRWSRGCFWPVSGYFGYDFRPADKTIYANIYLGYAFGTRNSTTYYQQANGGFSFSVGVDYRIRVAKKILFQYEVFYKYQSLSSSYNRYYNVQQDSVKYTTTSYTFPLHFIGFKIGITLP